MDKKHYEKYVNTDCWQLRRAAYLKKHGCRCELCGAHAGMFGEIPEWARDNPRDSMSMEAVIEVHHLSYEHLGQERDDDLLGVCDPCHKLLHGLSGAEMRRRLVFGYLGGQTNLTAKVKQVLQSLRVA